jgi:DNA-binding response OmpR family regulator
LKPTLKIAFISGYGEDSGRGEALEGCVIIEKPISPDLLLQRIRRILDSGPDDLSRAIPRLV